MNIIGRLTGYAEVRTLSNKKQVVNFSIATNDNYRNKQGERIEQTAYFECAYPAGNDLGVFSKNVLVVLRCPIRPADQAKAETSRNAIRTIPTNLSPVFRFLESAGKKYFFIMFWFNYLYLLIQRNERESDT